MTPKELFTTAARVIGLWQMISALEFLVAAFDISRGFYRPTTTSLPGCLIHAVVYFVVAVYLLGGASHLANWFYRSKSQAEKAQG